MAKGVTVYPIKKFKYLKMKKSVYIVSIIFMILIVVYCLLGYFAAYISWYGYEKWKDDIDSPRITESITQRTFTKKSDYKINNCNGDHLPLKVFTEKRFEWEYHTSNETKVLNGNKTSVNKLLRIHR